MFEACSSCGSSDSLLLCDKTALRVIMTTITMMITIMYTALLFLLQLCGFSANFLLLWLTVINCKSHELDTTPAPHQYCVLSTGMMAYVVFFPLQTPIKANPYSPIAIFWCLAVWSKSMYKPASNHVVDGNVWGDTIWRSPPAIQNITVLKEKP